MTNVKLREALTDEVTGVILKAVEGKSEGMSEVAVRQVLKARGDKWGVDYISHFTQALIKLWQRRHVELTASGRIFDYDHAPTRKLLPINPLD